MSEEVGIVRDGKHVVGDFSVAIGEGVVGTVAATGRPLRVDRVSEYEGYVELVEDTRSEPAVPLKLDDRVLGVLDVESPREADFDQRAQTLLEALASPVALAIRTAQLLDDQRRRNRQLELLNRVSHTITSTSDVDELLQRTADEVRQMLECDLQSWRAGERSFGIGLAFCRQAIVAHEGTIWAESHLGDGSCFHVLIPDAASVP